MSPYRRIVVVIALHETSEVVARQALQLAKACSAELTLVHAIGYFPEDIPNEVIPPEDQDPETFFRDRAHEQLLALARRIGADGARLQVLIGEHSPGVLILDHAQAQQADLIVVGALGQRPIPPLAGTLAEHLVRHGTIDVLAICHAAD